MGCAPPIPKIEKRRPRIMNTYMKQIEASAQAVKISAVTRSLIENSRLEFSIINSEKSGKHIRLSNDLALTLGITESVDILPIEEEGLIMVAKKLPFNAACTVALDCNRKDAKIAYNSAMVDLLTEEMDLDFEGTDHEDFYDIAIKQPWGRPPVALIRVYS